jgi:shikimate dehydrogenase
MLGLIGDNIVASRAPLLHRLAGSLAGIDVRYDLLILAVLNQWFDDIFSAASSERHGLNITLPYKERVKPKLRIADPLVRSMGAVNTVLFGDGGADGSNTDHSGFMAACRGHWATQRRDQRVCSVRVALAKRSRSPYWAWAYEISD